MNLKVEYAGPSLVISFVIAGFVATLASLCYAEMAALVPISGSAYTYAYATLGELVAWVIGFDLLLEYGIGAATVAVGWSGYFSNFITTVSKGRMTLDPRWTNAPYVWLEAGQKGVQQAGFYRNVLACAEGDCEAYADIPAMVLTILLTLVLCTGVKISSSVNAFLVAVKIVIIIMFVVIGIRYIDRSNYEPFIPPNEGVWGKFGWSGILQASTIVFFAFIGFDAVSTTAQEAKHPQRDLPIGILASLGISTVLYLVVTVVLTGVKKYTEIDIKSPVATAIPLEWFSIVVDVGALSGLVSVMMVLLLGQPRILQSMASDGLLPNILSKVHTKTGVPLASTIFTGSICAIFAGLLPIDILGNMTSVGTLFAFFIVCISVPILRIVRPGERRFEVPGGLVFGGFVIPLLGAGASVLLIVMGTLASIIRLFIWMGVGLIIYAIYGFWNSKLRYEANVNVAFSRPRKEVNLLVNYEADDEKVM
ncbi:hypothetical protein HDV05_004071 [Chytridiales sp. JEL 0842]|nr:hypothetical protein HDV05_004071 [Chytridiales sp. JEL 0842]